jgi:hypothetical protein
VAGSLKQLNAKFILLGIVALIALVSICLVWQAVSPADFR